MCIRDRAYVNQAKRLQKAYRLYDNEDFYLYRDNNFNIEQVQIFRQTGLTANLIYPIDYNHRVQLGAGYVFRELNFVQSADVPLDIAIENGFLDDFLLQLGLEDLPLEDQIAGLQEAGFDDFVRINIPGGEPREDDYPIVQASLVGDSIIYAQWGPHTGRAYRLYADYAPDLDESGTLTQSVQLDYREYLPLGKKVNVALRGYGYRSSGNFPNPTYFGGLDTVRGFDFRSLAGDRGFYANLELRFPFPNWLRVPGIGLYGLRGHVFLDVGGAWFDELQDFNFWDSENGRLDDGVSSYGFGFSVNLLGLPLNWDFSRRWDFDQDLSDSFETSFWIGPRF